MWKAISTASPSWVGEGKNARVIQKGRVLQARVALGGAIALRVGVLREQGVVRLQ